MSATVPKTQLNERSKFSRNLLFWLLLLPVVTGSLFLCGQMAMLFDSSNQSIDTRSLIKANYQPWQFQQVPALDAEALQQDVINEPGSIARIPASTLETGVFWPERSATPVVLAGPVDTFTPTEPQPIGMSTLTPTPTQKRTFTPTNVTGPVQATVTNTPVRTATPTPTFYVASNTPQGPSISTPTATRTSVIWTPTPTRTPIIIRVTYTFTPTQTDIPVSPTFTYTPTVTATPTDTTTPTPTPTPTDTPIHTSTFTFTPIPTDTSVPAYIPIRPIAENSLAEPAGTDSCQGSFGYKNDNPYNVTIAKGANNQIIGANTDPDVPTLFFPGRQPGVITVVWNIPGPITWELDGRTATFQWCR
jgi:hypothetical protein